MSQTDLNALIGSRICHDLISPLGAIGNGLELLQMSGVDDSPEMALIRDSVETANARVRLFRIAFGAASVEQRVSWGEVAQAIAGFSERRLTIDWTPTIDMSRAEARLALLLLMSAESLMPHGGAARVNLKPLSIQLSADRFRADPEFVAPLTDATAEAAASEVHFACARAAADDMGLKIMVKPGDTTMMLVTI